MSADQEYQPKSILFRNQDFIQYISAGMGIIDFGSYFDNEMSKNKFIVKLKEQVKIAIDQKVCKVPKNFTFPHTHADNIDKIWNGTCYYGVNYNPFLRKFLYEPPKEKYDDVIPLPRFKGMIPNQKVSDETLLIQTRELWEVRYATQGSSYVSLINNGGFMHQMSDGGLPMFKQEDMRTSKIKTYFYSRAVFNNLMHDFEYFFNYNWNFISIEFQKIIDESGIGLSMEEITDSKSSFITDVD